TSAGKRPCLGREHCGLPEFFFGGLQLSRRGQDGLWRLAEEADQSFDVLGVGGPLPGRIAREQTSFYASASDAVRSDSCVLRTALPSSFFAAGRSRSQACLPSLSHVAGRAHGCEWQDTSTVSWCIALFARTPHNVRGSRCRRGYASEHCVHHS